MITEIKVIQQKNIVDNYIDKLRKYSNIYLFGASQGGEKFYQLLEKYNMTSKVKGFFDNNVKLHGKDKYGIPILNPKNRFNDVVKPEDLLVITTQSVHEINLELKRDYNALCDIDIRGGELSNDYFINEKNLNMDEFQNNSKKFQEVYSVLVDSTSKKLYKGLLQKKLYLDNSYIEGLASPSEEQYFEKDLIELNEQEVFVDCGSYDGDTLTEFQKVTNGVYQKYYAIEADPENCESLRRNVQQHNWRNIEICEYACWDKEDTLYFSQNQTAGKVDLNGDVKVRAIDLNTLLENKELTFLKMDIEGAEVRALQGAKNIIQKHQPILAICIYHELKHFYEIPHLIKKYCPDYHLFIRHYTELADPETVCYAIPPNRLPEHLKVRSS